MLEIFQNVLKRLESECLSRGYEMLLEADVSGWMFHLLLTQPEVNLQQIHFDTRVCDARGRFDIAIGDLQNGVDCICPQLVVEIKLFPTIGFSSQAHWRHYQSILNKDLPKLGGLDPTIESRTSLVVDGRGYLEGTYHGYNRREYLINKRNEVAPSVHVFIVRLAGGNWQIEYEAPETTHSTF